MRLLIEATSRVHACRTHDDLVHLFEQHGKAWRRQLSAVEHKALVRFAKERGRALEVLDGIGYATIRHIPMASTTQREVEAHPSM